MPGNCILGPLKSKFFWGEAPRPPAAALAFSLRTSAPSFQKSWIRPCECLDFQRKNLHIILCFFIYLYIYICFLFFYFCQSHFNKCLSSKIRWERQKRKGKTTKRKGQDSVSSGAKRAVVIPSTPGTDMTEDEYRQCTMKIMVILEHSKSIYYNLVS